MRRSSFFKIVIFTAFIAAIQVSLVVTWRAVAKILETTPFLGILVDAKGNPIPIQGYPQFGLGVAGVIVFSIFALATWPDVPESTRYSLRTLLVITTIVAVLLGWIVWLVR